MLIKFLFEVFFSFSFLKIETNRNTALTLACFQGRHEVVSLLVDRKANIEHRAKVRLIIKIEQAALLMDVVCIPVYEFVCLWDGWIRMWVCLCWSACTCKCVCVCVRAWVPVLWWERWVCVCVCLRADGGWICVFLGNASPYVSVEICINP